MKVKIISVTKLLALMPAIAGLLCLPALRAQPSPGKIEVRGMNGTVTFAMPGSTPVPLQVGAIVPIGSIVKTDAGAAVDLAFSHNAGVVRLLQSSALSVDKFVASDAGVEVQLYLMEGTM